MSAFKSITTINDYGKITINIRSQMEIKGISRNALARITNTRFEVIDKWYNGKVERIDSDILARLCYCLDCNVEDIIKYETK